MTDARADRTTQEDQGGPLDQLPPCDWSSTPLGDPAGWPVALRTIASVVAETHLPAAIAWGPQLTTIHNQAYLSLLREGQVAIGRPFLEVWSEARAIIEPQIQAALAGNSQHFDNAPFDLTRGGVSEPAWFSYCFTPLHADAQVIRGVLNIAIETTDLVRAEQAVRQSERQQRQWSQTLEQRVSERTAALHEQTVRLRQMATELAAAEHRERKRLASILHDDLQQLLVAARMWISRARARSEAGPLDADLQTAMDLVQQAVTASRDLSRQLRPPVLYEQGLVAALHWLAREMDERHQLHVALHAQPKRYDLADDVKALLYECVRELLFNVVKHAKVADADVTVQQEGDRLRITVADRGPGLRPPTEAEQRTGGMGLFSIRQRLEALGGDMLVDTDPGPGTQITMTVPLAAAAEREASEPPGRSPAGDLTQQDRPRVLIVDDPTRVREGLARLLGTDQRITVVGEAAGGEHTLSAIQRHQPHIVLLDAEAMGEQATATTREIRRRWPAIDVVVVSPDAPTQGEALRDAGAAAHLPANAHAEQIITTLADLVRRRNT